MPRRQKSIRGPENAFGAKNRIEERASKKVLSLQQGRSLKNNSTLVHPGKSRGTGGGLCAVANDNACCKSL